MLSGISLLLACGLTLNNAVSMPETAPVSETHSVYSENIYTPPATNPAPDERDSYENNDGFNVATPLSPENAHQLSSYHTQLTATIVNQDFDKVIQIPLYYSLRKENPNSETDSRSIISYKATLKKFESGDLFVCTSSSVSAAPDDCYSCYGKIYGFRDSADLDSITSLPEYSTIPDVEPNIKPLIFNESDNYDIVSLFTGQYSWYQFTAPETKTYYFLCSGEEGMIAELFSQPVKGYSTQGLIRSYPKDYYFSRSLSADETIYLRVRHQNYQSCHGIIYFDDEPFSFAEPVPHEHHYVRYVWKNTRTHTSYCECGFSTSQGHAVSAGSSTCLFCGGRADIGFIGPSSVSSGYISENGSYLLPNGVIVLDEKDIDAYLSGELTFASNTRFAA